MLLDDLSNNKLSNTLNYNKFNIEDFKRFPKRHTNAVVGKDVESIIIPQLDYRLWKHYHATHFPHHLTYTTMY